MLDQLILSTRKKKEITTATTKLLYYDATATRQGWGGETAPLSFHPALSQKFLCQITFHLIKLRPTDPSAGDPAHAWDGSLVPSPLPKTVPPFVASRWD